VRRWKYPVLCALCGTERELLEQDAPQLRSRVDVETPRRPTAGPLPPAFVPRRSARRRWRGNLSMSTAIPASSIFASNADQRALDILVKPSRSGFLQGAADPGASRASIAT